MARYASVRFTCAIVFAVASLLATATSALALDTPAALAAKASPALVGSLSKEIGATPEQSAGAAGALFGVAKSRLKAEEFSQIAKAVPGMDLLLKATPATGGSGGLGSLSQLGGTVGGLSAAAAAFSKLGLSPSLVAKAIPVLTQFVTKSGGANVGNLLAGALK